MISKELTESLSLLTRVASCLLEISNLSFSLRMSKRGTMEPVKEDPRHFQIWKILLRVIEMMHISEMIHFLLKFSISFSPTERR